MTDVVQQPVPMLKRTEIVVAVISIVGGVSIALLSNFDKVFGHTVSATYSGYEPTDDFETNLRYYLDISGARRQYKSFIDQYVNAASNQAAAADPKNGEKTREIFEIFRKKLPTFDDTLDKSLAIYRKEFSLAELQELNKFYSTKPMRDMVNKQPQIDEDISKFMADNFKLGATLMKQSFEQYKLEHSADTSAK